MFALRMAFAAAVALAPVAYATTVAPVVASAQPPDCGPGNWWNPGTNECQPTAPPNCGPGNWWNPAVNACQPVAPPPPR
jgi:hypothetical protein